MRYITGLIAGVFLLLVAPAALAAGTATPYGVWQGKIGKYPVVVRMADTPCDSSSSSYYYLSHLTVIQLLQNGSAMAWKEGEGDKAATWALDNLTDETLSGKWTTADGKRTLPIVLKRMAVPDNTGRCEAESEAYIKPLLEKMIKEGSTKDAQLGALRYRTLSVMDNTVSTFEIPPGQYHVPRLNLAMRANFRNEIAEAQDCRDMAGENGGDYESDASPSGVVFGHILIIRSGGNSYCGGAHPNAWSGYSNWNLATDTPVEPGGWVTVDEKLQAMLDEIAGQDDKECSDTLDGVAVSLGGTGLVFHTQHPHVTQACDDDIEVPFAKLKAYLTPAGEKAVRELMNQ